MEIMKSRSGYVFVEYSPEDVLSINEDQGMRYYPHSGCFLLAPGGQIAYRNFTPGIPEPPPLTLAWALRDRAREEGGPP